MISHFDELPENLHWLGLIIRAHIPEVPNHYQDSLNDPNLGGEKKSAIVVSLILNFLGSLPFNSLDLSRDCSYSSLDIPLLLAFLYQVLPQFVPRMKIDVSGTLFEATAKRLELSNNTNRTAHYRAFLDGCSDFQIGFSELNIAPNAVAEFDVKFKARFLKSEHAILKLVSSRVAFGNTSVVLFPLFATVSQTGPSKQFKISSPLYMVPPISSNIEVKNVFTRNGRFKINFQQARVRLYLIFLTNETNQC